jgi:uncharacterized protein YwgA
MKDLEVARDLAERLEKVGVHVSLSDAGANVKGNWLLSLEQRIWGSDEVIVLLTRNSVNNQSLMLEMGAALGMHKRVTAVSVGVPQTTMTESQQVDYVSYADLTGYIEGLRRRALVSKEEDTTVYAKHGLVLVLLRKLGQIRGTTRIMKLIFILTKSRESQREPYRFYPHTYGPYSKELSLALRELEDSGLIKVTRRPVHIREYGEKKAQMQTFELTAKGRKAADDISKEIKLDKRSIRKLEILNHMPLRDLIRQVYRSYPDYVSVKSMMRLLGRKNE